MCLSPVQLELDIAGLRAEIDKYSLLLDIVPDPKKKSSPARTASPSTQGNKRRRTETGTVAMVTPTVPAKKRAKAKKAPVVEEVEEEEEEEMEEDDDDEPMDLNDDGRITRSESRVYRAKKTPKGSKSTSKKVPSNAPPCCLSYSTIAPVAFLLLDKYTDDCYWLPVI